MRIKLENNTLRQYSQTLFIKLKTVMAFDKQLVNLCYKLYVDVSEVVKYTSCIFIGKSVRIETDQ